VRREGAIRWMAIVCLGALLGSCSAQREDPVKTHIALLEAQVDRLRDAREIKHLQRAYGYYVDKAMWDEVADLFARDATIEYGNEGVYVGQERIREYLMRLGGGRIGLVEGQLNNHLQLQPVVHVASDGGTAKGRWRTLIMVGEHGKWAKWGEGIYENEYVKEDGVWKIARLHWYTNFVAPYNEGWAKMKPVDAYVSEVTREFPPDRPPTVDYKPYPAAFVPPFHYENPGKQPAPAATEVPEELKAWQREVARLEAREAIENLQGAYGYYFDKGLWDEVAALFTRDGTYETAQRGVYVGPASIRKALELEGPPGPVAGWLNNYFQLQPVIHVSEDGKTAKARWRTIVQKGVHGKFGQWGEGTYENEYALEDGVWKIRKLHHYVTITTDYDRAWAPGAIPIEKASKEVPPDRPPTEVYESYPNVYLPPYHYPNLGRDLMPEVLPPATRPELERLAHKIQRLKDANAIENLQRAYGYYVDKSMWDEATELFADDATLEIGGRGVFVGKERVRQYMHFLPGNGPQYGQLFNHTQFQPIVHVADDGRTAKARLRAIVMAGMLKGYQMWGEVTYENEYVNDGGIWKISKLWAYFNMYCNYEGGWVSSVQLNSRPAEKLPPDRPPTIVYDLYPAVGGVPFHYKNPVTGGSP
jgi:hypothetical protein